MEASRELLIIATQKQILNLWFRLYLMQGLSREEAARKSHTEAETFLREVPLSKEESDYLLSKLVLEETWVNMMVIPD